MAVVKARLIYDELIAAWRIHSPFVKEWVTEFKAKVPHGARTWNAGEKCWVVDPMFLDVTKELCTRYFGGWTEYKAEAPPAPPPAVIDGSYYKEFITLCPGEALKVLYRAAMVINHPDKGGSTDRTARLNAAWDRIKKDLGI